MIRKSSTTVSWLDYHTESMFANSVSKLCEICMHEKKNILDDSYIANVTVLRLCYLYPTSIT